MSQTTQVPAPAPAGDSITDLVRHPLRVRELKVVQMERPTPGLIRLTLGGPELDGFVSLAPDDHVKLLLPVPGQRRPNLPGVAGGQVQWGAVPDPRPIARDYTPVHHDPSAQTLVLEVVRHAGGLAAGWAEAARVGDVVGLAGPRGSHVVRPALQGLLLVGDETALPAIGRWLRELPSSTHVQVYVELPDEAERRPLPTAALASVTWLMRGEDSRGSAIEELLLRRPLPRPLTYAWVAGEAAMVRRAGRLLTDHHRIARARVSARGYWKRGVRDHQEPHDD